jgi:hypothetical protein
VGHSKTGVGATVTGPINKSINKVFVSVFVPVGRLRDVILRQKSLSDVFPTKTPLCKNMSGFSTKCTLKCEKFRRKKSDNMHSRAAQSRRFGHILPIKADFSGLAGICRINLGSKQDGGGGGGGGLDSDGG